jgi:ADP-ribosylation factor GTPase-activating protein 1
LADLQENPLGALSKGWSLFSSAVVGAGRVVSENVIQPSVERVTDPDFQASVKGYMTEAQKRAAAAGGAVNQWSKHQLGVDVGGSVGGMVGTVTDRFSDPTRSGYGAVPTESYGESSSLYQDGSEDSFFHEYDHGHDSGISSTQATSVPAKKTTRAPPSTKKNNEWDDEWKDF